MIRCGLLLLLLLLALLPACKTSDAFLRGIVDQSNAEARRDVADAVQRVSDATVAVGKVAEAVRTAPSPAEGAGRAAGGLLEWIVGILGLAGIGGGAYGARTVLKVANGSAVPAKPKPGAKK